jgi:hypothetical protein
LPHHCCARRDRRSSAESITTPTATATITAALGIRQAPSPLRCCAWASLATPERPDRPRPHQTTAEHEPNTQVWANQPPTGIEPVSAPNGGSVRLAPGQIRLRSVRRSAPCEIPSCRLCGACWKRGPPGRSAGLLVRTPLALRAIGVREFVWLRRAGWTAGSRSRHDPRAGAAESVSGA